MSSSVSHLLYHRTCTLLKIIFRSTVDSLSVKRLSEERSASVISENFLYSEDIICRIGRVEMFGDRPGQLCVLLVVWELWMSTIHITKLTRGLYSLQKPPRTGPGNLTTPKLTSFRSSVPVRTEEWLWSGLDWGLQRPIRSTKDTRSNTCETHRLK